MATKMKIRKGDHVVVVTGKDKGKKGDVLQVQRDKARVVVQGVNVVRRHTRPSGIVEKEAAIHVSNVALIDPKDGNATKVGFKVLKGGQKVRFARRSGEMIDR